MKKKLLKKRLRLDREMVATLVSELIVEDLRQVVGASGICTLAPCTTMDLA
jgi:hypothetical protein